MQKTIDIDAYLSRIGYSGSREASLRTLRDIHARHAETIAFENLDPFMRRPLRLDPASLERKLVHGGRGGYCFEQNLLLSHALTALGFNVTRLAARVLWNQPEDRIAPRSHMLLCIDLEGTRYIADVGFGGLTLTTPLRLETNVEQQTSHEPFRLVESRNELVLQAKVRGDWKPLYRFGLQEQLQADYEATSWYFCNHPESKFINQLMVARTAPGRRYALLNNHLSIHHRDGPTERRTLTSGAELRELLRGTFGLNLTDSSELDAALERVTAQRPAAAPFAVREIDHVVLRVRDVALMRQFYCDVLGCRLEKIQGAIGLVQLRAGRSLIDLVDVAGPIGRAGGAPAEREGRNVDHICLRIEPFDAAAVSAHLRAFGVEPGEPASRYGAEGEGPSLYLTDPEGNTVELKGPPAD